MEVVSAEVAFAVDEAFPRRGPFFADVQGIDIGAEGDAFAGAIALEACDDAGIEPEVDDLNSVDAVELIADECRGLGLFPGNFGMLMDVVPDANKLVCERIVNVYWCGHGNKFGVISDTRRLWIVRRIGGADSRTPRAMQCARLINKSL